MNKYLKISSLLLSVALLAGCGSNSCSSSSTIGGAYDPTAYTEGLKFALNEGGESYHVDQWYAFWSSTDHNMIVPAIYNGKPVTSFERGVFAGDSLLDSVFIPKSITDIPTGVFAQCRGMHEFRLASEQTLYSVDSTSSMLMRDEGKTLLSVAGATQVVDIPNSVTTIASYSFEGCPRISELTIPEGVTKIGSQVFYLCTSLSSLSLPVSLTELGYAVFDDVDKLISINYAGTKAQWSALSSVSYSWDASCSIKTIVCSDGTITR